MAAVLATVPTFAAEPENWDGVEVLPNFYVHKTSHDGNQLVGESENGGTVYYNRTTGEAYYYANCDFGRGYVVSDKGWIVGSELLDVANQTNVAVIMKEGNIEVPDIFKSCVTSNIHSITPDGSRICGVINPGTNNRPFYCDIDGSGNLGAIQYLPTPDKDFFGARPQYCSATWISDDGKTIAGQVIDARGLFSYPIIYTQTSQNEWNYSFPSQPLFNPQGLEVPEPLGEFDEEFPDAVYPDVENYISPDKMDAWQEALNQWSLNNYDEALNPYDHLQDFMTEEKYTEYFEAEIYYNACQDEYNEMNELYWERMIQLADESVLFVRNAMAISSNGKWLASSGEVLKAGATGANESDYYYDPYLFNLETREIKNIGIENLDLVTNQVLLDGTVLCSTPVANVLPPRSYIYKADRGETISIYDYVNGVNSTDGWWMESYLTGDIQVSETAFQRATITGMVATSQDLSSIYGGVLYSALGNATMFITYMMDGLPAGIEEIESAQGDDGSYTVYSLQGVKVMHTTNAADLNNLSKGIYVINGRKALVGK